MARRNIVKNIKETYNIRGEKIVIESKAKIDLKTGKQIFDEKLDNFAINKAFDVYRDKYNIMDSTRIKDLRKIYGLSQRDFAKLLGFSSTTLATYETGALPNVANNKILLILESDPFLIKEFYKESKNLLSNRGQKNIKKYIKNESIKSIRKDLINYINSLFIDTNYTEDSGYNTFDISKLVNIVLFFVEKLPNITKTKMNKLLFYTDFKYFKDNINSITGLSYAKLPYGPVPNNYKILYPLLEKLGFINIDDISSKYETFKPNTHFNKELFDDSELSVMEYVLNRIGKENAKELSNMSHHEEGWKEVSMSKNISYGYSEKLSI